MYIYQIERDLLYQVIKKRARWITGRILDVGGGSVHRYKGLFVKATKYVTVDIDSACRPDIVGDAINLPVGENTYQGLICTQVLGDIFQPENAIKEFFRVLKPGGTLLLSEGFLNEQHGEPVDYWRFTKLSFIKIAENNGFVVKFVETYGGLASVIAQMITRYLIDSLHLYNHNIYGRIFSHLSKFFGTVAVFFDKNFLNNIAGDRFYLGIVLVAQKHD